MKAFFTGNRFKSFCWRSGAMVASSFLVLIANSLTDFGLTGQTVVVLGLIIGELTKYINSYIKENNI